jgi:hypothetical protein
MPIFIVALVPRLSWKGALAASGANPPPTTSYNSHFPMMAPSRETRPRIAIPINIASFGHKNLVAISLNQCELGK